MPGCCGSRRSFKDILCCRKKEKPVTILGLANRIEENDFGGKIDNDAGSDGEEGQTLPIDYHLDHNKETNRTSEFEQDDLIVRRSNTFKITIEFDREVNELGDVVMLELSTGKKPLLKSGTLVRVRLDLDKDDGDYDDETWFMTGSVSGKSLTLDVNVPSNACLGKYAVKLYIRTRTVDDSIASSHVKIEPLYVLANPFSARDKCYNENGDEDNFWSEYVLNENGAVWRSGKRGPSAKPWIFGQFDSKVLEVACYLITADKRTQTARGGAKLSDLVQISRIISAMVNSNDDDGVLTGRWDGNYADGMSPVTWNSSIKIMAKYIMQDYSPVKYGQCWVFSAVVVSLMRCLGIPCRSVTNYSSAHDTDNTMTIDNYFTEDNKELKCGDSIWNFHVWNEVWLQRPDLPEGYDGWQAIDATPQEETEERMQCGPAPVKAIKNGETFINYDTPFVFAEVNADSCYWLVDKEGEIIGLTHRSRAHVGKTISTTAPGLGIYDRLDLTDQYKQKEGSAEEEANFKRAYTYAAGRADMKKFLFRKQEVPLEMSLYYANDPEFGKPIDLVIKLTNNGGFTMNPSCLRLTANSVYQRGEVHKYLAQVDMDACSIEPGTVKSLTCSIPYEDYRDKLAPDGQGFVRCQTLAKFTDCEKGYTVTDRVHMVIEPPTEELVELELSHETCYVGDKDIKATVRLTNKMDSELNTGKLTVEGLNLFDTAVFTVPTLQPKSRVETTVEIKPTKPGKWTVIVDFKTDEMVDMKVFKTITVEP